MWGGGGGGGGISPPPLPSFAHRFFACFSSFSPSPNIPISSRSTLVPIPYSALSLSSLAAHALKELSKRAAGKNLTAEVVADKIKILAERRQYLASAARGEKIDTFEDTRASLLWRWELTTIELLPEGLVAKAKKARYARIKLRSFHRAVTKLLSTLDEADACFLASPASPKVKRDKVIAKVSADEEKVLRFEREEEKARLIREAKAQKEAEKVQRELQRQQEKERAEQEKAEAKAKREEERKLEKVKREEEKKKAAEDRERMKQEAAKAREEAKLKKDEEEAEKKRKETQEKENKVKAQKALMLSFFGSGSPAQSKSKGRGKSLAQRAEAENSFDSDSFWKKIVSSDSDSATPPPFKNLSTRAKESRKRKTKSVSVTVFATVLSSNPFQPQPYDEERVITIPNKYKYLQFHEDYRPPYHGTWSKPKSTIVTGKTPFAKDNSHLDYEVDSEAEWEEGDDEDGEDVGGADDDDDDDDEDDGQMDGEECDTRVYSFDDGWLAQDDEYDVEDGEEDDEETSAIRKSTRDQIAGSTNCNKNQSTVCVVAPMMGGLPMADSEDCPELISDLVEGADVSVGMALLNSHVTYDCIPDELVMDIFPPSKGKKEVKKKSKVKTAEKVDKSPKKVEMTKDDVRALAKFVHHSTLNSKDKVIEGVRNALSDIKAFSRAEITRKLDSIAKKRWLKNGGGTVWEVRGDVLDSLGLEAKDLNPAPVEKEPEKKSPKRKASTDLSAPSKKGKKSRDPNEPKRSMSAYLIYSNALRAKAREEHPEAKMPEICQILAAQYKALSDGDRAEYDLLAAEDRARYAREMEAYQQTRGAKFPEGSAAAMEEKVEPVRAPPPLLYDPVPAGEIGVGGRIVVDHAHRGVLFKATVRKTRTVTDGGEKKKKKKAAPAATPAAAEKGGEGGGEGGTGGAPPGDGRGEPRHQYLIHYDGNKKTNVKWIPFGQIMGLLREVAEAEAPAGDAEAEAEAKEAAAAAATAAPSAASGQGAGGKAEAEAVASTAASDGAAGEEADATAKAPVAAVPAVTPVSAGKKKAGNAGSGSGAAKRKRPAPAVSAASKNLLLAFMTKKKKPKVSESQEFLDC